MATFHSTVFFVCLVWTLHTFYCEARTNSYGFYRTPVCGMRQKIPNGCALRVFGSKSVLYCIHICSADQSCIGASVKIKDANNGSANECFKHFDCPSSTFECDEESDELYTHFSPRCNNNGLWNSTSGLCQCVGGWVGQRCLDYATGCAQLMTSGYAAGPLRSTLDPDQDGENLIKADCYLFPPNYCHVLLFKTNGHSDFNRTWSEYRDGFRNNLQEWIGLRNLHFLTLNATQDVYIAVTVNGVGKQSKKYSGFSVFNESIHFAFTFGKVFATYTGNPQSTALADQGHVLQDCFGPYKNIPFSTWDRDHDTSESDNCAAIRGSGWWLTDCNNSCHLLGWSPGFEGSKPPQELMSLSGFDLLALKDHDVFIAVHLV